MLFKNCRGAWIDHHQVRVIRIGFLQRECAHHVHLVALPSQAFHQLLEHDEVALSMKRKEP